MREDTRIPPLVEHLAQMPGKMALVQKVEERQMLQNGEMNIEKAPHGQQGLDQFCGRDQEAQAQSWKQHFAQGTDIEHPPGMVQSLERLQRAPTRAVFAIIVILQNPRTGLSGPVQQR